VSEYWPDKYRAKCTSLVHSGWPVGYGLATVAYMWVTPHWGWRGLFFIGIIPAIIAIWFRTAVPEPEAWKEASEKRSADKAEGTSKFPLAQLFRRGHIRLTLLGGVLASGALMAYWGSATWLPSYLVKARGLNIVKTAGFLIFLNSGAFLGYQFFGWLADKHGRRLSFTLGMCGSIIVTLIYVLIGSERGLLYFGPVFGFVSYGFFGPFGAFISELFPAESRATGTTLVFNIGRCASMASPYIIGALAESRGLGFGLGATVIFNLVGLVALFLLPETVKAGVRMFDSSDPTGGAV
jgi:MFS family permease